MRKRSRIPLANLFATRGVIFCGVFLCFIIIVAWIASQWRETQLRRQTLPDGSVVIFRGVSYGTAFRFPTGNFWERLAVRVLPSKYTWRFPSLVYNNTNDGPALAVWIEHVSRSLRGGVRYGGYPAYGDPPDWQGLFDDSGTDFDKSADLSGYTTSGSYAQGFFFHALPGASRNLHFRFVCADAMKRWQGAAVFTFRNPAFRESKQKQFMYPLAVQQDNLKLVLTEFRPEARRKGYPNWTGLSFDLFEDGQPANDWELHALSVLDQNGAVYNAYAASWGHRENHTGMSFAGGLSTNAPWRLRFVLKHATFRSNELCTVTNLAINSGGNGETNLAHVPINGTTLVIKRTAGDGDLRAMLVPGDDKYYLNFVDVPAANGRPFDRGKTYSSGQTDTNYYLGFPPEVTNVDLTFGVTRKFFIEAVAQPTPR